MIVLVYVVRKRNVNLITSSLCMQQAGLSALFKVSGCDEKVGGAVISIFKSSIFTVFKSSTSTRRLIQACACDAALAKCYWAFDLLWYYNDIWGNNKTGGSVLKNTISYTLRRPGWLISKHISKRVWYFVRQMTKLFWVFVCKGGAYKLLVDTTHVTTCDAHAIACNYFLW